MAYVDLDRTKVAQLSDADLLNQIKDNINYLAQPPIQYYEHSLTGGNYSTTSQEFLVPIDSTNMKFTIDFRGNVLIALLILPFINSDSDGPAFGLSIDDYMVERTGDTANVAPYLSNGTIGTSSHITTMHLFITVHNLGQGTHTVEPVWAANPAGNPLGTVEAYDDYGIFFGVWER